MRIVSLLPSATEMIYVLGLRNRLVGVTHECDFPTSVESLPKVTRSLIPADASSLEIDTIVRQRVDGKLPLYQLDLPMLHELQPDLIVTQALCDVCAVDEEEVLRAAESMPRRPRVISLQPTTLTGTFEAIREIAEATGNPTGAAAAIDSLTRRVERVAVRTRDIAYRPSVVFLEWLDPFFCAGHWNPELVDLAGGRELIGRAGQKSRRISQEELAAADPDLIFVACCGFGIHRTGQDVARLDSTAAWQSLRAVRNGKVHIADGSALFNRPGPRLVDSLELLSAAIFETRMDR